MIGSAGCAAPKDTCSAKIGGNYAPTVATMQSAEANRYGLALHLDSTTHTMANDFSASGLVEVRVKGKGTTLAFPDNPIILRSITVDNLC
ncbi:hypothetical protein BKA66DRAFT_425547 [Pyrenochaeta sp. MPI-SDFR-AT-0127]|nr:hypothetical protein BKA66DRAFT_425547 [Pyrenochaeta sp. MPI-SDFR-AT-0127]